MQIHILEEAGQGLAAIDKSVRRREIEIRRAQTVEPIERLHLFAGWGLDETTRDLMSPTGQRLDSGAKRNGVKRSGFERPFQARQSRLGLAS
jgi:hypothetical protein